MDAGYRVEWVDGFGSKGKLFFNVVFRPERGARWSASHNLDGAQYQAEYDKRKAQGYRLAQVDSYPAGGRVLYAAVFARDGGPAVTAYHGVPAAEHQKKFDALTAGPWKPKNISVVSLGGERFYTALYEAADTGSTLAKSFLTAAEYQQLSDENKQKGRQLAYLNAYEHQGQPRFTAIWNSATKGSFKARRVSKGVGRKDEGRRVAMPRAIRRGVRIIQTGRVRPRGGRAPAFYGWALIPSTTQALSKASRRIKILSAYVPSELMTSAACTPFP